jgi:hypothetical protein
MTLNGPTTGTLNGSPIVSGDGVDDIGRASAPAQIPQSKRFSVAVSVASASKRDNRFLFGADNGTVEFQVGDADFFDGSLGEPLFQLTDANGNAITVEPATDIFTQTPKLLIITKDGDAAQDVQMYIQDMETPVSRTTVDDTGFSSADYSQPFDMGFFGRIERGGAAKQLETTVGRFEFYSDALDEQERKNVKNRANII